MWVNLGMIRMEPDHRFLTLLRDTHEPLPLSTAPASLRYRGLRPYTPLPQLRLRDDVEHTVDVALSGQAPPVPASSAAQVGCSLV